MGEKKEWEKLRRVFTYHRTAVASVVESVARGVEMGRRVSRVCSRALLMALS